MSGILNTKQRLIDFSLTSNGYKQIQNGDIRFVYATLTDKDAIYAKRSGEYNVADPDAMPFFFETYNKNTDVLNTEIDLNISQNYNLRTEINNEYIDFINNEYVNVSTLNTDLTTLFDKISLSFIDNLNSQNILFSNDYSTYDFENNRISDISLNLKKINSKSINTTDTDYFDSDNNIIFSYKHNGYVSIINDVLNLNKFSMIEDDRFQNKFNFLYLPPTNMKEDVITSNPKIKNTFNVKSDKRHKNRILLKTDNLPLERPLQDYTYEDAIIQQIKKMKLVADSGDLLNAFFSLIGVNDVIEKNSLNLSKFEFEFDQIEINTDYLINLHELFETQSSQFKMEKLVFINHGDVLDNTDNKRYQVYSAGKIFSSKNEIDLDDNPDNNKDNGQYIIEDNYLFVNLFTIVIE